MCHDRLGDGNFYALLLRLDEDLAAETRAGGCQRCGSALHKNRYQRKPRGGGLIGLTARPHFRLSFTCSKCDKRHRPASVRFLDGRVYLAATVVLASALRAGLTDKRAAQLIAWLRVPKRTLERWRTWWRQDFAQGSSWRAARAAFMPPVSTAALPASLLQRFEDPDLSRQLEAVLVFLTRLREGR
jgi:hypothetical protein